MPELWRPAADDRPPLVTTGDNSVCEHPVAGWCSQLMLNRLMRGITGSQLAAQHELRTRPHAGAGIRYAEGRARDYAEVSSSTQSRVRVTAFFQTRRRRSRSSAGIAGNQRRSSCQSAVSSSRDDQKPTASPAA